MFRSIRVLPLLTLSALALAPGALGADLAAGATGGAFQLGVMQTGGAAAASAELLEEDVYILGAGDGLTLRFLVEQELSGPVDILNDGTASLPLLGNVRLTGLTVSQASLWLESLYKRQLLRPELQLTVSRPRPLRVAVVGEVERPGVYTLSTSEQSQTEAAVAITGLPTLVDAIQKAGGLAAQADLRQVVLQRRLPGDRPLYKRARVNLFTLVREGDLLQNPLLFDGDTIRVLRAEESAEEAIEVSTTTLSPTSITVNVVGEVKAPGRLQLPANIPLVQSVLAAGGPQNWRANTGDVELVRINRNGTATRERFRLNYGEGASNEKNPPLRDGDTVVVNRSNLARTSDAIGAVASPLSGLVNIWALVDLIQR
ncbi:MAG: polysaccharide biosynthesis/export family protein [Cyanobacteriota bacterium]